MMIVATGTTGLKGLCQLVDDAGLPSSPINSGSLPDLKLMITGQDPIDVTAVDLASADDAFTAGGVFELGNGFFLFHYPNETASLAGTMAQLTGESGGQHVIASPIQVGVEGDIADEVESRFAGSSITTETNFNDESEELNIKRTDDYTSNTGQRITFIATGFVEFPTDSVYFRASRNGVLLFAEVLCETAVLSPTTQSVTMELTRDQIVLMAYGAVDDYRFRATYVENTAPPEDPDNGEYRTIRWGKLNVERVGA